MHVNNCESYSGRIFSHLRSNYTAIDTLAPQHVKLVLIKVLPNMSYMSADKTRY